MRRRLLRDEGLRAALPGWLVARGAVGLGFVVAIVASDELRPGSRTLQIHQGLFSWDAAYYRDIADYGYGGVARQGLRFFPLLPLAARALSVPLFGHVGLALVLLVNASALASAVLLYRLALVELGDRDMARRAAWLLSLLPPATVLVLGYAEALFLFLAVGTFLALRQSRWGTAAALGLLAGLCRPIGLTLALPALIESARGRPWRAGSGRAGALLRRAAAIVAPVAGCGAYLMWVEREYGDWALPLRLQNSTDLRGGLTNPLSTIGDSIRALAHHGRLGDGLHVPWLAVFAVLLVVVFLRLPVSYGAWSFAQLGIAASGHTLGSFERYGLVAFPLVLALATVTRPPAAERAVLAACAAGLAGFTALIFLGAFVP